LKNVKRRPQFAVFRQKIKHLRPLGCRHLKQRLDHPLQRHSTRPFE
jgi:hypothetical protein